MPGLDPTTDRETREARGDDLAEVQAFVEELRGERDRLLVELEERQTLERDVAAQLGEPRDDAEQAMVQREVDRLEPLARRSAERIDAIQRLLERAAQGRVAVCDRCEGPIPLARLRAIPGTTVCADCKEDLEREARRGEATGESEELG